MRATSSRWTSNAAGSRTARRARRSRVRRSRRSCWPSFETAVCCRTLRRRLRERLSHGSLVLAPGVYDALTALLAEQAGFEALYLSGASIAYTRLGRPDIGLVTANEVADTLANICGRVRVPVIVDADTGYGNALNVVRTVKAFERAGAAAIQLEDQSLPKRCGHLDGK